MRRPTNLREVDLIPGAEIALHFRRLAGLDERPLHSYGRLTDDGLICGRCGACLGGEDWMNTRCPGPRGGDTR